MPEAGSKRGLRLCGRAHGQSVIASLLAVGLAAPLNAQFGNQEPDKLIEATTYENRAREELQCQPDESLRWAKKAVEEARQIRSASQLGRDTAGILVGRLEQLSADAEARKRSLADIPERVRPLIRKRLLFQARTLLESAAVNSCAQYASLKNTIDSGIDTSSDLVRRGDVMIDSDPSGAKVLFLQALEANSEIPNINTRIKLAESRAKEARQAQSQGGGFGKGFLIGFMVAAGLAAGGYYAYKELNKSGTTTTVPVAKH